jgi:hypothetical protein
VVVGDIEPGGTLEKRLAMPDRRLLSRRTALSLVMLLREPASTCSILFLLRSRIWRLARRWTVPPEMLLSMFPFICSLQRLVSWLRVSSSRLVTKLLLISRVWRPARP